VAVATPVAVSVADRAGPVDRHTPEPSPEKEAPAEHQVTVAGRGDHPAPEQEGEPPEDAPAAQPQLPTPPAQVEKPLAAIPLPPRADEPFLPSQAPAEPSRPDVGETCQKAAAGEYGTAVHFARDPAEAAKLAKADNKLMVVFTISGNFEDSKFT
jgi:hypothetical protein